MNRDWFFITALMVIVGMVALGVTLSAIERNETAQQEAERHAEFLYAHATCLDGVDWPKTARYETEEYLAQKAQTFEENLAAIAVTAPRHILGNPLTVHWRVTHTALDQVQTTEDAYKIFSATTDCELRRLALEKMDALTQTEADKEFYEFVRQGHTELFYKDCSAPATTQTDPEKEIPPTLW